MRKSLLYTILVVVSVSCNQSTEDTTKPEDNRFTTTVLTQPGELDEPMVFDFLDNETLLFVERKGNLKSFNVRTREMKTIATIPVNTKYTSKEGEVREAEEGLMGLIADPDFQKNHWIYMYYADPAEVKHVLARWELHGDSLYNDTKKIMLEVPTQREVCCHTGGGMVFDKDGNLYLTTGNNTGNPVQGTSGLDERPDRSSWDDQRTAGSTNDLRGKILRIHPEDDGSYTIPEGNLFPEGTEKTRPEIYTMGHRNPWRVSIDSKTGYIYWGEVGPDASRDSTIGPRGYDEFNQAKGPGFFGWPYFIADNKPYADYDYATNAIGSLFDVNNPVNNSPNNTGLEKLPPPQKAFIWYPYSNSEEFPLVGSSGRSATGGPVFRKTDFASAPRRFPAYYEGKLLIVEFMRGWIMAVTMDENGNYQSMEQFLPGENFSSAIDMKFGPEGDLYVLEYGSAWFRGNANAQIKKIEFNAGNRKPIVSAAADRYAGALPFAVKLSSEGTVDYDKDELKYEWKITSANGFNQTLNEPNPSITLDKEGVYTVNLTVTDAQQQGNSRSFELHAGNEPPVVNIEITEGNKSFFFPNTNISYSISVSDKEDGSLADKTVKADEIAVNFDYVPEGFDPIQIAQNHRATDEWTSFSRGAYLIGQSDCKSCHIKDKKSVGPSYLDVAQKYGKAGAAEQDRVAKKIISGGSGVWGDHAMSAHPGISEADAKTMFSYILSLATEQKTAKAIPLAGRWTAKVPEGENGKGGYLLRAAYQDKGSGGAASLGGEYIVALRNPFVDPETADFKNGTDVTTTPNRSFNIVSNGAHIGFRNMDLSGIKKINLVVQAQPRVGAVGGVVEIRLDAPDGQLIGTTEQIVPKEVSFREVMAKLRAEAAGKPGPQPPIDMAAVRRLTATNAAVDIEAISGSHDLYFVFRNETAKPGQILVQVNEIGFYNQ